MFLSRLKLNPQSRQVQSELRDRYEMHRTISKAFGAGIERYREARCLFRVDDSPSNDSAVLIVQSRILPSWDYVRLMDGYLKDPPEIKEYSPILHNGDRLRFRLCANPTIRRDGKRVGIYDEGVQLKWLERKAEENGFRVLSVDLQPDGRIESRTSGSQAVFASVTFEGRLLVSDESSLMEGIENGIGSGKGFGFGLLSVARG